MLSLLKKSKPLTKNDVKEARKYIKTYWSTLTISQQRNDDTLIGLPKPYIVPAIQAGNEYEFRELYYWDTYFVIQGLLVPEHKKLVLGMLEDLLFMFKTYGIIPNSSRSYMLGRSQPPLLTSMIWDIYEAYDMGVAWLGEKLKIAEKEYNNVWMATKKPHERNVYEGLSRYYDINVLHDLAETESGWDMTPRFNRHCLDYLPVDLNNFLYIYEVHFARYAHLTQDGIAAQKWEQAARERQARMNELMWNTVRGLYYDYNFKKKRRGNVSSLAGLVPLWSGTASPEQAKRLVWTMRNKFQQKGGLSATDVQQLDIKLPGATPTQWAYPNGWAPLHLLIIQGLERYGYTKEAQALAHRWLRTNLSWFQKHGVFLEKYNVVNPDKAPAKGVYPTPAGFGWTNAVFERLCQDYIDKTN